MEELDQLTYDRATPITTLIRSYSQLFSFPKEVEDSAVKIVQDVLAQSLLVDKVSMLEGLSMETFQKWEDKGVPSGLIRLFVAIMNKGKEARYLFFLRRCILTFQLSNLFFL